MRTLTLLIVTSVIGLIGIGAMSRNGDKASQQDEKQALKTLLAGDRASALHLLEPIASSCVPELAQVKSNNGRKLLPRIILVRLDTLDRSGDALTTDEKALIDREIDQLVRAVPETDYNALSAALDRMEKEKTKVQTCISNSMVKLLRSEQR
jgi:hypothetical protein